MMFVAWVNAVLSGFNLWAWLLWEDPVNMAVAATCALVALIAGMSA